MKEFWSAVQKRRSIYALGEEKLVPEQKIEEIMEEALLHTPSAFNSQSTRLVLLFGKEHQKLWQIVLEELQAINSPEAFAQSKEKVNGCFAAGYGTVLFFEEQTVVEGLQASFPGYAKMFPVWSEHANAMHQFVIWTALAAEGLGVTLQHYNPLIDNKVRAAWKLPESWKLVAQMPFGSVKAPAGEKEYGELAPRLKIFK